MESKYSGIKKRADGSYLIDRGSGDYHIPKSWPEWVEVNEYVEAHPEEVELEPAPPEPTLEELKTLKAAQIAAARYEEECAGITIQGVEIATDRDSQGLILGAVVQAQTTPGYTVNWKTKQGFVTLSAEQIIAIATAVRAHVQACFDREAYYLTQIEAATTPEELEAMTFSMN